MKEMDLFAPLSTLQWVDRSRLKAKDYNPNKVSEDNLQLFPSALLHHAGMIPHHLQYRNDMHQ